MKYLYLFIVLLFSFQLNAQVEARFAFNNGVNLLNESKFAEAEKEFDYVIKTGIDDGELKMAFIYRGFARNGQYEFQKAIEDFSKAIEMDSSDAASFIDRGKTYAYMKDNALAIEDFRHVIEMDSIGEQAEAAYYYLGRINSLESNFEEAIGYFDSLLKLVPTDAEAYYLRAVAKGNLRDIEGSIEDYNQAIKYKPDYKEAYTNRAYQKINALTTNGNVFTSKEETKSACEDFEKAMELGDKRYELYDIYCTDMINSLKK